jgi:hypothetical protein
MRMHRRVGVTILSLLACAVMVVALSPSFTHESAANVASAPGASAMRVYLDPETGAVSSTPTADATFEIEAALDNSLRHDTQGLAQVTKADGTTSINLDGRYNDVMVVRVDANGKQEFCTGDVKTLAKGMTSTTPTGPEVK